MAGSRDSCGAAFPLQGCCWLGAAWGCVVPGGNARLCDPAWAGQGRPEPGGAVQQMALLFSRSVIAVGSLPR